MIDLKRILVSTDFSETSRTALRYGIELAQRFGARLYLFHVPPDPGEAAEAEYPIGIFEIMQNDAHDRLLHLLTDAEARDLRPECAMRVGTPAEEIVKYATEHDIDLIVLGTHGRRGVARLVLGSVAEQVVRTAPCPVLTAHYPEHEFIVEDEPIRAGESYQVA
jgi:nucleotide-binding universal stress UspA family protein